ncbi:MAG TPA: hypothetical protein VGR56_03210 [Nitrososphaerales archaeon]|nr:hypothetical protein [Nitrososphaerales archaeon]
MLITILPIGVISADTIAINLLDLVNPCAAWGIVGGSITIARGTGCSLVTSSSETFPQFLLTTIVVQGGILFAVSLGVLGFLKARPMFLNAGFVILSLESALLIFDGLFVFTLLPASFFLFSAKTKVFSE